jgi:hypothetical protein
MNQGKIGAAQIMGDSRMGAAQIAGDLQGGVTALGTTQATAQAVYGDNVVVTTAAASSGVILSGNAGFAPGDDVFVANQGANALTVYPPVGGQINALGANVGFSVAAGKAASFRSTGGNQFYSILSA